MFPLNITTMFSVSKCSNINSFDMGSYFILGFHTMLPRSSEAGSGAIRWWQWLKIAWNYFWTPRFNPLTVGRFAFFIGCVFYSNFTQFLTLYSL